MTEIRYFLLFIHNKFIRIQKITTFTRIYSFQKDQDYIIIIRLVNFIPIKCVITNNY